MQWQVMTTDEGEEFISCCYQLPACGCAIRGGGTLQQPLTISFCTAHAAVYATPRDNSAGLTGKAGRDYAALLDRYDGDESYAQMAYVADKVGELRPEWTTEIWHSGGGIYLMGLTPHRCGEIETDLWVQGSPSEAEDDDSWLIEWCDEESVLHPQSMGYNYILPVASTATLDDVAEAYIARMESDLASLIQVDPIHRIYY